MWVQKLEYLTFHAVVQEVPSFAQNHARYKQFFFGKKKSGKVLGHKLQQQQNYNNNKLPQGY